jgi:hypothetical protein
MSGVGQGEVSGEMIVDWEDERAAVAAIRQFSRDLSAALQDPCLLPEEERGGGGTVVAPEVREKWYQAVEAAMAARGWSLRICRTPQTDTGEE